MQDIVSLIIPVYNVENYIDACIHSVVHQTYRNLEIILVDDGSTDTSGAKCDVWAQKDERIRVIHKENGGLSSARNTGIELVQGAYIVFVDSDDTIDVTMIEKLYHIMRSNEADIVICNRFYVYEDGRKKLRYRILNEDIVMDSKEAIRELNSFQNFDMSAWGKMYRRELFDSIRFPVGRLSEDYFIMYQLFDCAGKIVYHSEPLCFYMQREGSISKRSTINLDFVDAAHEQMRYVERKYPELKDCVHAAYASACMTVYNIVLRKKGYCEKDTRRKLQRIVRENMPYINRFPYWSKTKKIQAYLFVYFRGFYQIVIRLYRR